MGVGAQTRADRGTLLSTPRAHGCESLMKCPKANKAHLSVVHTSVQPLLPVIRHTPVFPPPTLHDRHRCRRLLCLGKKQQLAGPLRASISLAGIHWCARPLELRRACPSHDTCPNLGDEISHPPPVETGPLCLCVEGYTRVSRTSAGAVRAMYSLARRMRQERQGVPLWHGAARQALWRRPPVRLVTRPCPRPRRRRRRRCAA